MNLWQAWRLSKVYRTRPSEIYAIESDVTAWCFDNAVMLFGGHLESEIEEATKNLKGEREREARSKQVLYRILGLRADGRPVEAGQPRGTFMSL